MQHGRVMVARLLLLCLFVARLGGGVAHAEVPLYLVDALEAIGGATAGTTVTRLGGGALPLAPMAALQVGDRLRVIPPTLRVRLCGAHQVILTPGEYEILAGGAIRQLRGRLAYDSHPCAGTAGTTAARAFELLLGEGSEPVPLGVRGTRFLADAQAPESGGGGGGGGADRAPALVGAGLDGLRVIVGEGEVVLGKPEGPLYPPVKSGHALVLSGSETVERAAEAAELAELEALFAAIPVPAPAPPEGSPPGTAPPVPGPDTVRRPLVKRAWFWGLIGGAAAAAAGGGITAGVLCTRPFPDPTLGRIGGP
jgi:hypothetical protein